MKLLFCLCFSTGLLWTAPVRVLFVGNSYTYFNSMPRMVEELAQAAGQEIEVRAFTRGGATLLELELHPELRGMPPRSGITWCFKSTARSASPPGMGS